MGLANSTKEKHAETFSMQVTWVWLMGVQRKNMGKSATGIRVTRVWLMGAQRKNMGKSATCIRVTTVCLMGVQRKNMGKLLASERHGLG